MKTVFYFATVLSIILEVEIDAKKNEYESTNMIDN